jgi:hypothetical protein
MTTAKASATIETSLGTITISERTFHPNSSRRAYVSKPRIYVSSDLPLDVLEDMTNRRRRPFKQWRKGAASALAESGLGVDTHKMGWDQQAGCGCGCSPGFVLDNHNTITYGDLTFINYDVWVQLTNAPMVDEEKPARELVSAL